MGINGDMYFISHDHPETIDAELKSHSNPFEAEYAVRLAKYLLQQNYKNEEVRITKILKFCIKIFRLPSYAHT